MKYKIELIIYFHYLLNKIMKTSKTSYTLLKEELVQAKFIKFDKT